MWFYSLLGQKFKNLAQNAQEIEENRELRQTDTNF